MSNPYRSRRFPVNSPGFIRRCYLLLFAGLLIASTGCGDDDGPLLPEVRSISVTHLNVLDDETQPFKELHSINVAVGVTITGDGSPVYATVTVGLLGVVPEDAADDDPALTDAPVCLLGAVGGEHPGDGSEVIYQKRLRIPTGCLPEGSTSENFNIWVFVDSADQIAETSSGAEDDNIVVFNSRDLANIENQACRDDEGDPGCIYNITLVANPGPQVLFRELNPDSSVAILWDPADPPSVPAGGNEWNPPALEVDSIVLLEGLDEEETNTSTIEVFYEIRPASSDATDTAWRPLTIYDPQSANDPAGHQTAAAVDDVLDTGGESVHVSHDLYIEGESYDLISQGDWSSSNMFEIRGCVRAAFQQFDPAQHCRTAHILLVRPQPFAQQAASYTFNKDWDNSWGKASVIKATLGAYTHNSLGISGASTDSAAYAELDTIFGHVDVLRVWASAAAKPCGLGSFMDAGIRVLGNNLWTYHFEVPSEYEYQWPEESEIWSYDKQKEYNFCYGFFIGKVCFTLTLSGHIGLDASAQIHIRPADGTEDPYLADADALGNLELNVTPHAEFGAAASANVSIGVARAGAEVSVNLFSVNSPIDFAVRAGCWNDPPRLRFLGEAKWEIVLNSLAGSVYLYIDIRRVKWCKKWRIPYPCGLRWDRKGSFNLASWQGLSYTFTPLNQTAQYELAP